MRTRALFENETCEEFAVDDGHRSICMFTGRVYVAMEMALLWGWRCYGNGVSKNDDASAEDGSVK